MQFFEGQIIVHPFHGPARVLEISERVVQGNTHRYVRARLIDEPLEFSAPLDRPDAIGLRPVSPAKRLRELVKVLAEPSLRLDSQWARRIKDLRSRLGKGDIEQTCIAIRELIRVGNQATGTAEHQMLREALPALVLEFSLGLDITTAEAHELIEHSIRGETLELPTTPQKVA